MEKVELMKDYVLQYAAKIDKDDDGFNVVFGDFEDVFTCGDTLEEALFNAQEVLELMLVQYLEDGRDVPASSAAAKGEYNITVSPEIASPVLLYQLRKMQKKTQSDVAKALGVSYQQYQRLEKTGGNITLKSLKKAAAAMGAIVEVRLKTA